MDPYGFVEERNHFDKKLEKEVMIQKVDFYLPSVNALQNPKNVLN